MRGDACPGTFAVLPGRRYEYQSRTGKRERVACPRCGRDVAVNNGNRVGWHKAPDLAQRVAGLRRERDHLHTQIDRLTGDLVRVERELRRLELS